MSDRTNEAYMDLVALLVAAVILLIMISITEAAAGHEWVVGNLSSLSSPDRADRRSEGRAISTAAAIPALTA